MESNTQAEKRNKEKMQLQDTYNDEHWLKKYGVTAEELKGAFNIGLPAKIIAAIRKNELTHA